MSDEGWLEFVGIDGDLERRAEGDRWLVPGDAMSVEHGVLRLSAHAFSRPLTFTGVARGLLGDFLGLAGAPDADRAVLRYASRWGLLRLCREHWLPSEHEEGQVPVALASADVARLTVPVTSGCVSMDQIQPVAVWLFWSRQAGAILRAVEQLRRGAPVLAETWATLCERGRWDTPSEGDPADEYFDMWSRSLLEGRIDLDHQRRVVAAAIGEWLRLGRVGPTLAWRGGVPEAQDRYQGLFGAIGVQLLLAAIDSSGTVRCPGCGRLHSPPRSVGRPRRYCDNCRAGNISRIQASRRARLKRRASTAIEISGGG